MTQPASAGSAKSATHRPVPARFNLGNLLLKRGDAGGYLAEMEMAARFPGAVPEAIRIVGRLRGEGTELSFPAETEHPLIQFTEEDGNEEALGLFDRSGFRVWLQVEPGNAPVEELIHLMLDRMGITLVSSAWASTSNGIGRSTSPRARP